MNRHGNMKIYEKIKTIRMSCAHFERRRYILFLFLTFHVNLITQHRACMHYSGCTTTIAPMAIVSQ